MGNSQSLNEGDDENSQNEAHEQVGAFSSEGEIDTAGVGGRDSPIVSDKDESQEQDFPQSSINASIPDISAGDGYHNELRQGAQQGRRSPWNMAQSTRSDSPVNALVTPGRLNQQEPIHQEPKDANNEEPPNLDGIGWQASNDTSPEMCLEDAALATCSFLSTEMTGALLGHDWESEGQVSEDDGRFIEGPSDSIGFGHYSRPAGIFFPWVPPSSMMSSEPDMSNHRRLSNLSATSDEEGSIPLTDFYPPICQNYEWMGRSIETLILGHRAAAPILALPKEELGAGQTPEETVCRPKEERCTRRTSVSSLDSKRSPHRAARRASLSRGACFRRGSSSSFSLSHENPSNAGPNVLLSLLAREVSDLLVKVRCYFVSLKLT